RPERCASLGLSPAGRDDSPPHPPVSTVLSAAWPAQRVPPPGPVPLWCGLRPRHDPHPWHGTGRTATFQYGSSPCTPAFRAILPDGGTPPAVPLSRIVPPSARPHGCASCSPPPR